MFVTMYALMRYEMALLTECLVTDIASVRAVTTMCELVSYEIALCNKCLITQCTGKKAVTTMYSSMT
jgi:hypothetical protein